MVNTVNSIICFLLAYVIVSLLEIILAIVKIKVFSMKPLEKDLFNYIFKNSRCWRVIFAIITFSVLGYAYNSSLIHYSVITALLCSVFWLLLVVMFDLLFRVIIQNACSFTIDELFKDNLIWTILTYVGVIVGPFIGLLFL